MKISFDPKNKGDINKAKQRLLSLPVGIRELLGVEIVAKKGT